MSSALLPRLVAILERSVGRQALPERIDTNTPLLGAIPELDSMALLGILAAIEREFAVQIDDSEVDASLFADVGALLAFIAARAPQGDSSSDPTRVTA